MITVHPAKNTSVKDIHNIQTLAQSMHNRLSVQEKLCGNKNGEVTGVKLSINAIRVANGVPTCMSVCDIQDAM